MLLNIMLVVIILVATAMVVVILLQRSEGGALGMSGGGPGNFMSARGTGDLLSRTTQILAGVFFALCLLMTLISSHERAKASIVNHLDVGAINTSAPPTQQQQPQSSAPTPVQSLPTPTAPLAAPAKPANPLDLFGQGAPTAPKGH